MRKLKKAIADFSKVIQLMHGLKFFAAYAYVQFCGDSFFFDCLVNCFIEVKQSMTDFMIGECRALSRLIFSTPKSLSFLVKKLS